MTLLHTALDVEDIEESLSFYDDVVGYEKLNEFRDGEGVRNAFVGAGHEPDLQLRELGEPVDVAGVHHLGLDCADVDEAVDRVDGNRVRQEPTTLEDLGVRVAFVEDPDGYVVELIQAVE